MPQTAILFSLTTKVERPTPISFSDYRERIQLLLSMLRRSVEHFLSICELAANLIGVPQRGPSAYDIGNT